MKLFRRQKDEVVVDPYAEPSTGIDWRRAIPRLLALAIILALIVTGVLWAFGVFNDETTDQKNTDNKKVAQTSNESTSSKPANSESGTKSGGSASNPDQSTSSDNSGSNSSNSSSSSSSSSRNSSSSSSGSEELSNTGPGDVAAIFAVTTVAGTILYQTVIRRRTV